jgi:SpoVK/Ycf46/Vps4 family AAA+-type ATPase
MAELDRLIGLADVKKAVRKLEVQIKLDKRGAGVPDGIHSLFLGGPGTGKSTVAKLMGKILHEIGATKTDKVVIARRQDLVAPYIGQSAERTKKKIDEALGGTLFVDEAYMLVKKDDGKDFGQEVLDTLLAQMDEHQLDLVVIAAGYQNRMNDFIESNPGLKERFRLRFNFEDYKPDELMQIFDAMLASKSLEVEKSARTKVMEEFKEKYKARDEGFGNARMVRNFISDAYGNMAERMIGLSARELQIAPRVLTDADVSPLCSSVVPPDARSVEDILSEFNKLTGLGNIKGHIKDVIEEIKFAQRLSKQTNTPFNKPILHSLFLGSPGTGKTTVARLMGEVYRALGLLPRGQVIEVTSRGQIIAQYMGQTVPLVRAKVKEAIGGVLFIDEAYSLVLGENDLYGQEAVAALVTEIENRPGQLVVIAAGYPKQMAEFLNVNPGLKSRFPDDLHFDFEDYSSDELWKIFEGRVRSKDLLCGPGVQQHVLSEFSSAWRERGPNFANGRAVRNYLDAVMRRVARRVNQLPEDTTLDVLRTIVTEDLQDNHLDRGIETKKGSHGFKF